MATLEQTRHIELVSGAAQRFVVTNLMTGATIPAQLPHLGVFVMKIVTRDDPQDDTFQRVARIADLSELPFGRDAGLINDPGVDIEYLSSTVVLSYPNLSEAKLAATAIKDRVNAIITEWIDFKLNFDAPIVSPAVYTLPETDASQVDVLIAAYKTAKQDRYQKQLLSVEASAALTRATTDYNYKKALLTSLDTLLAKGIVVDADMASAISFHAALLSAGTTFLATAGCALLADRDIFQDALDTATNEASVLTSFDTDVTTLNGLIGGLAATLTTDVATAGATLSTAQADQLTKAQALTTAQATEATALAAVLAVCPDFEKNSIPMVDDNEP